MASSSITLGESQRGCIPFLPNSLITQCLPTFTEFFQRKNHHQWEIPTSIANKERGCIAFFSTYRPPLPLHIYSCPSASPTFKSDEKAMVDGETESYNYNGRFIPPAALRTIIRSRKLGLKRRVTEDDISSGRVSGLVFVSERTKGLETLHFAFRFNDNDDPRQIQVVNFAEVYETYDGVRMEDSGCVAGDYHVYVSTMERNEKRRQPWTAVYRTHLRTGLTERLTPPGVADLSPSVSPSGKKIAVASFQEKEGGWTGEIENLLTDIVIIDMEDPTNRKVVVKDGGWPTWGSEHMIYFHRKIDDDKYWAVFRANISNSSSDDALRVSPEGMDAVTPAAIDDTRVVVATIRQKSGFGDVRVEAQYRHIEIFDLNKPDVSMKITQTINPLVDHFNPFFIVNNAGEMRIGYHRCHDVKLEDNFQSQLHELLSPASDVAVCRAAGVFPSFSKDGKKLAFVNNEFTTVFVVDNKGKRPVYKVDHPNGVFAPFWNENSHKDTLYVCVGASFDSNAIVEIWAIHGVSGDGPYTKVQLTNGGYNNAFPTTNPEGTRLVYRSTRDWMDVDAKKRHKNLYIMENAHLGESGGEVTRLTNGRWTDTHCEWSPNGKWIVFSSTRQKPEYAPESDNGLDPGYFSVFLVKVDDPNVVVKVIGSGYDQAGHVNHPFFSPDGKSIVVVADLAAVSVDPISMPLFLHSVRPYGDIFVVDIDSDDIYKNENVQKFERVTHSRFENSTSSWSRVKVEDLQELWKILIFEHENIAPSCPFLHNHGGHGFFLTGHLCIPDRSC